MNADSYSSTPHSCKRREKSTPYLLLVSSPRRSAVNSVSKETNSHRLMQSVIAGRSSSKLSLVTSHMMPQTGALLHYIHSTGDLTNLQLNAAESKQKQISCLGMHFEPESSSRAEPRNSAYAKRTGVVSSFLA